MSGPGDGRQQAEGAGSPPSQGELFAAGQPLEPGGLRTEEARPSPPDARGPFEVAVVGAGLAGLATASLLARAGRSVVALERASEAGGVCRPLRRGGLCFEAAGTLLHRPASGDPLRRLCDRLAVELPVRPLEPVVQVALPGHRLTLSSDPGRWVEEFRREAPVEEAAWQAVWRELGAVEAAREQVARELPGLPPEGWGDRLRVWRILTFGDHGLRPALAQPFRATLARHGLGPVGQRGLEAVLWHALLRDADECSTLEAAMALGPLARGPMALAAGMERLVAGLQARLQADGACLRLGTEVTRLLVERGRVSGVVTAEGETIRARQVVAAISPLSLQPLLPAPSRWRRPSPLEAPWRATHLAQMLLVAVPEAYLPSELGEHCLVVADAGRPARDDNLVFLHVGSAAGTEDLRSVTLTRFVPAPGEAPGEPALMQALDEVIPGAAEVARHREAPATAEVAAHWGRPHAAVRYGPEAREWLGQRGMPARPGWPGLWTVGEWTFPGRQVPWVIEGAMRAADRLLEEL